MFVLGIWFQKKFKSLQIKGLKFSHFTLQKLVLVVFRKSTRCRNINETWLMWLERKAQASVTSWQIKKFTKQLSGSPEVSSRL